MAGRYRLEVLFLQKKIQINFVSQINFQRMFSWNGEAPTIVIRVFVLSSLLFRAISIKNGLLIRGSMYLTVFVYKTAYNYVMRIVVK